MRLSKSPVNKEVAVQAAPAGRFPVPQSALKPPLVLSKSSGHPDPRVGSTRSREPSATLPLLHPRIGHRCHNPT
jgi:hypothetical protein